jgi:hypothetical protein
MTAGVAGESEKGKVGKAGSSFGNFVFLDYGEIPELIRMATSIYICMARMFFGVDRLRMQFRRQNSTLCSAPFLLG